MPMPEFRKAVDDASLRVLADEPRGHLGPSQLGGRCLRQPFYDFRQVTPPSPEPNAAMERLANRGHEEEHRIVRWLRALPEVEVRDYAQRLMYHDGSDSYTCLDWDDNEDRAWAECDDVSDDPLHIARATARSQGPRQWGFSLFGDHHKGSCDGKIHGLDQWLPEAVGWGLLECKTSNEKSFTKLAGFKGKWNFDKGGLEPRAFDKDKHGLWRAKPEHYKQMQQYMHQLGLPWGLYVAVNKETDEIYYEWVKAAPEWGERLQDTAEQVVTAQVAPPRQSSDPSFYGCGLCPHKEVCHYGAQPALSCRSCAFVEALTDRTGAKWYCRKHRQEIPDNFVRQGCQGWEAIS